VGALLHVVIKEFLQLRYDRKMIPVMILAPLVQIVGLGYAANLDVHDVPLLLVDQDRTPQSRALADRFTGSGYFQLAGTAFDAGEIEYWLRHDRAKVALVIADGYGEATSRGGRPRVQVIADGTDSNSAVVGLGYASRIVAAAGVDMVAERVQRSGRRLAQGRIELVPRVWYNPDLRSRWFFVPAVVALVLILITMMLPSMAIVREKEIGTLEQISVTPLRPWQLMVGKLVPFAVIGILNTWVLTAISRLLFGVPLRGSVVLLTVLTLLYLLNTLSLGLFVSTVVHTQQQAMMFSAFVLMVPMIYLSGLIFPIENMPAGLQYVTYVIPTRYYGNVVRGIFLKGSGIEVLWRDALALAAIGLGVLTLASLRFRKSLD
jgi:ABC-2 type transport system permease protein